jgi:hypothetical protein
MAYLPLIGEDELKYICNSIPIQMLKLYIQQHPEEFARLAPGFHHSSFKKMEAVEILMLNKKDDFISNFLEKYVDARIKETRKQIDFHKGAGDCKELAQAKALLEGLFNKKPGLFYKLTGQKKSRDYLALLTAFGKFFGKNILEDEDNQPKNNQDLKNEIAEKDKLIQKLEVELQKKADEYAQAEEEAKKVGVFRAALMSERNAKNLITSDIAELNDRILKLTGELDRYRLDISEQTKQTDAAQK